MFAFGVASAGRILVAVVLVWLILIFFIGGPLLRRNDPDSMLMSGENAELILARLSRATSELVSLRTQNEELRNLLQNYFPLEVQVNKANEVLSESKKENREENVQKSVQSKAENLCGPNKEYELARRRLMNNFNELWHYLHTHPNITNLAFIDEHHHNYMYDLKLIQERDAKWRKKKLKELAQFMSQRIDKLQNPEDCNSSRKLVCQLNKGCGFGCQIHHVGYCFIVALATRRTLILDAKNWRYAPNKSKRNKNAGWDAVFQPLSRTCLDDTGSSRSHWRDHSSDTQVVDLPIVDGIHPRPAYLPLAIPAEISEQIIKLHGSPTVWFIGQIVRYIMRPSATSRDHIEKAKNRFNFRTPVVGVHVRRTDKLAAEASYHSLSEYMQLVEAYYDQQNLFQQRSNKKENNERLVYLATDDASIWGDEVPRYKELGYVFLGDSQIAQTAGVGKRYSHSDSLKNIILDIWLLSESDHLVCTFSSQVCRLAYELMQTRGLDDNDQGPVDWSFSYNSLDDIYYYGGQNDHNQRAILDHTPYGEEEIVMKKGDIIGIAGNHWNGYSKGLNRRTHSNGLYPGFKTEERILPMKFKGLNDDDIE